MTSRRGRDARVVHVRAAQDIFQADDTRDRLPRHSRRLLRNGCVRLHPDRCQALLLHLNALL